MLKQPKDKQIGNIIGLSLGCLSTFSTPSDDVFFKKIKLDEDSIQCYLYQGVIKLKNEQPRVKLDTEKEKYLKYIGLYIPSKEVYNYSGKINPKIEEMDNLNEEIYHLAQNSNKNELYFNQKKAERQQKRQEIKNDKNSKHFNCKAIEIINERDYSSRKKE